MDRVLQAGALARLDPNPAVELAVWQADLDRGRIDDPAETRRRLAAYEAGEQLIVRLELFAEVESRTRRRSDGMHVTGLWFEAGADATWWSGTGSSCHTTTSPPSPSWWRWIPSWHAAAWPARNAADRVSHCA